MQSVRLTRTELLTIADINVEALKSQRRRDQIALAFSDDDVVAGKMYTPVDAVALMISAALAQSHGAVLAASLVRATPRRGSDRHRAGWRQQGQRAASRSSIWSRNDGRRAYFAGTTQLPKGDHAGLRAGAHRVG